VGAGPYRFVSRDPSTVILERFEDYWEEGKPTIARIEFRNIKDATTIIAGMLTGDIHLSYDVPRDQARVLESRSEVVIQTAPGWEHTLLHMANGKAPFSDVKVRQAMRLAIDPGAGLAAFGEKYIAPAYGAFVPRDVPYSAYGETEGTMKPDLEKARALIAESSVPNGFAANIAVNPGAHYEALALAIQQQLQPLGIEINIQRLPAPDTIGLAYSHDFDMILMYWIADYTDISSFLLQWYGPNGGQFGPNFTEYANPEYDKHFETSLYTTDAAAREAAFIECQRILTRDQPSLCLAFPETVRFQSALLEGAPVAPVYVYDRYADLSFTG
jgi:peptide/nickel transport system substrate-binding protein